MKSVFLCAGGLLLAGLPGLATASNDSPPLSAVTDPEEILVLPPIIVKGSVRTKGWIYARAGRTEIYSQLSVKDTRGLIDDLLIFQDFVSAHFPEAALPDGQQLTVLLFDRTKTFRQLGGQENRTSSALPGSNRFILIDAAEARHPERSIRRRYVALAFDRQPPDRYPLWRQFGTREILARIIIRKENLELGAMLQPMFGRQRSPDMFRLLTLTASEFTAGHRQPGNDDYYHATFFMHMCLFGATRPYRELREPYQHFIRRLEKEPLTEELFHECFGMDFAAMGRLLQSYMAGGTNVKFESRHYRFIATPGLEFRPVSPEEILSIQETMQTQREPVRTGTDAR